MKNLMLLFYTVCSVTSVFASDITWSGKDKNITENEYWSDKLTPHDDADYWLLSTSARTHWSMDWTFGGKSFNLGSLIEPYGVTSSDVRDNHKAGNFTYSIPVFNWWKGNWSNIAGSGYPGNSTIKGALHVKTTETDASSHAFAFGNSTTRTFIVESAIDSDYDNAVLTLNDNAETSLETLDAGLYCQLRFSGDNTGYTGTFVNKNSFGVLAFETAKSIGDPATPNAVAVRLFNDAAFAAGVDFGENTARGIRLDGDAAYFMTWTHYCPAYTVRCPVSKVDGSAGKLIVRGTGKVTLDCPYTAGDIEVQSGTLKLGENLSLAPGTAIHVCSGATLIPKKDMNGIAVTVDMGGCVAMEVEYDPTTRTATPIEMTAAELALLPRDADGKISVCLSSAIPIPFSETNVVDVIRITGGQPLAATVFVDRSPKTYGLPTTWFSSSSDGIRLMARPVIQRLSDANYKDISLAGGWSDGKAPHAGADYYSYNVTDNYHRLGGGSNIASFRFGGESLTLTTNWLRDYAVETTIDDLRLYGGVGCTIYHGNGSSYPNRNLNGRIFVADTVGDDKPAYITYGDVTPSSEIYATICGRGSFRYEAKNQLASIPLYLRNDAGELTGHLLFKGQLDVRVDGGDDRVFGGDPGAFDAAAVQVAANSAEVPTELSITATENLTVDTPNRGWKITQGALGAAEGKTFTFNPPSLDVSVILCKTGKGTLALACPTTAAAGARFVVKDGTLMPKSATCCRAFETVEFEEGAGLEIDAAETDADVRTKGLSVQGVSVPEGGKLLVTLRNWRDIAKRDGKTTCAVLTLPSGSPDLTQTIEPVGRGAVKELTVKTNDDGSVTYVANFSLSGLSVLVK